MQGISVRGKSKAPRAKRGQRGMPLSQGSGSGAQGGRAARLKRGGEVNSVVGAHSLEQRPGARPVSQESPVRWSNQTSLRGPVAKGSLGHCPPMFLQL